MRGALFHHRRRGLGKIAGIWRQQAIETRANGQKFAFFREMKELKYYCRRSVDLQNPMSTIVFGTSDAYQSMALFPPQAPLQILTVARVLAMLGS